MTLWPRVEPVGRDVVAWYDPDRVAVGVVASHTALQILHGARSEGLRTVLITTRGRLGFYADYSHLVDHVVLVESWAELCRPETIALLRRLNTILVPHGSLVEYVGPDCAETIELPLFGLRSLVRVEASQKLKMKLLREAGIPTPREYGLGEEFEGPVIVKLPGAKGGKGYFLARSPREVMKRLEGLVKAGVIGSEDEAIVQEYVVGVPAYYHYYYSPLHHRLILTGVDIRYESNVDGLRRLPPAYAGGLEPSFTVVGNLPLVMRESLLPRIMSYGEKFVEATRKLLPPGIIGPFSLESIVRDDLEIVVFEFSGRIVAGTNLYTAGSPYTSLLPQGLGQGYSVGRLVASEIREAAEKDRLADIVT